MPFSVSWLESIGGTLLVWGLALAVLILIARRGGRARRGFSAEHGFDYTLNLIVTIPLLALAVIFAIETTIVLSTKLGTVYAGYAAARSAEVWETHGPDVTSRKSRQGALLAMAPFSRGLSRPVGQPRPDDREAAIAYSALYRKAVAGPVRAKFLENQYLRAAAATRVKVSVEEVPPTPESIAGSTVAAEVSYRYPFRFGLVARVLASGFDPATGEAYLTIRTTVRRTRQEVLHDPAVLGAVPAVLSSAREY